MTLSWLGLKVFASLPEGVKSQYEDKDSSFGFGWSHGKEKLENGVPGALP